MTKDQQDLAWACLPKEVRDEIKSQYNLLSQNPQMDKCDSVYLSAFENIFGHHNLTSATEPEEMLMVKREIIQEAYKHHLKYAKDDSDDQWHWGIIFILSGLFGDKCLPDKPNTPNSGELKPQMAENKPKFKVGDKVRIILCTHPEYRNKVGTITSIDSCGNPYVKVDGLGTLSHAPYALESYTEENKEPMEKGLIASEAKAEQKEAKELNLCELLKGCEGEKIFLPDEGEVVIEEIEDGRVTLLRGDGKIGTIILEGESLIVAPTGFMFAYPSEEDFLSNPFNALHTWMEWKESRKPKRWTPQIGERFFFVNAAGTVSQDFCRSEIESNRMQLKRRAIGNEFQTGKAAEAFAKIFREALTKFHEKNNE